MWNFFDLIQHFFTHKDFLPSADQIPGTLFTPLHFLFSTVCAALILWLGLHLSKKSEATIRTVFAVMWAVLVVLEISKIVWETVSGSTVKFEWGGILPLYPCSIFMYAMPFAIWGKGAVRYAGCGYVCTLGLLGGLVNFVYPANILGNYSCLSFAGFHTFIYHGSLLLCALVMLRSGYHSYKTATKWHHLLLPMIPLILVSFAAHPVNFSPINSDYLFFRLNSFFFAPIGAATPDWFSVILVYFLYLIIHTGPYLPFFLANRRKRRMA